ncbi:hypothetical protein sync_2498 [Synechococcus sp. CC9311]|nr:hypothetical protein sync_2495 [Synechococcus sp. CC9311]ABI46059.1 hypothetical protein sync_2498 [Synechococcus sp. CC9311]
MKAQGVVKMKVTHRLSLHRNDHLKVVFSGLRSPNACD